MKYTDYYAILELEPGASEADIRKAYRRPARRYHPDVSEEPDAEARFQSVGSFHGEKAQKYGRIPTAI